jgi:beta-glucosidase/6-phospho-beta-glucosidase/beta-galactosidase
MGVRRASGIAPVDSRAVACLARLVALTLVASSCGPVNPSPTVSPPAKPAFLWGVATSSYQVEGGITCPDVSKPAPWLDPATICNDYDFFNRNEEIRKRVKTNSQPSVFHPEPEFNLLPSGEATRFWNDYERDLDNAALLGLNAFRISLEWARIEPQPPTLGTDGSVTHRWDEAALSRYGAMIDAMIARGLRPIVVLHHFTLPAWVLTPPAQTNCYLGLICKPVRDAGYGSSLKGWEADQTVVRFADFVRKVVPIFRDRVDHWITVNEPVASQVVLGYVAGVWSPGFVGDDNAAKLALNHLIRAHVAAYDIITSCTPDAPNCDDRDADGDGVAKRVGFAHAVFAAVPAQPGFLTNPTASNEATANFVYFGNDYFLNAIVNGDEDVGYLDHWDDPKGTTVVTHDEWKGKLDFVGVQYYRRFHVFDDDAKLGDSGFIGGNTHNNLFGEPDKHGLLSDLGWDLYPQGLSEIIVRITKTWHKPVLVSENGLAEATDRNRAAFLVAHIREIRHAIDQGADVFGYLHWSIADNWELAENYRNQSRFGLFRVERDPADPTKCRDTCDRLLTEGALAYQHLIFESQLANAQGVPTHNAISNTQLRFGAMAGDGKRVFAPTQTDGRLWEGALDDGTSVRLYLSEAGPSDKRQTFGVIRWGDTGLWRRITFGFSPNGPLMTERWFEPGTGRAITREQSVHYVDNHWDGTFTADGAENHWSASPVPGVGLWRWNDGWSPWGGAVFEIAKFGHDFQGKYLTYSSPGPLDLPSVGGCSWICNPQVSGSTWAAFGEVTTDDCCLRLVGSRAQGGSKVVHLFDVGFELQSLTEAITVARKSGPFVVFRGQNIVSAHFGKTGYLAPAGDVTWSGWRADTPYSGFHLLEHRALFRESANSPQPEGGRADQFILENDPTSVMPARGVSATPNSLEFEAGGRFYSTLTCSFPPTCFGTWIDVGGKSASRASDGFSPFSDPGPSMLVSMQGNQAPLVKLDGTKSFGWDAEELQFLWTVGDQTRTGPVTDLELGVGSHEVCLTVTNGLRSGKNCKTVTVTRGGRR